MTAKTKITCGILLALAAVSLPVAAQEKMVRLPRKLPVTGMEGWPQFNSRVTGVAFAIEDAGWPTLRMLSNDAAAPVPGALRGSVKKPGHLKPIPLLFGCISVGGDGQLKEQTANQVSNTLVFGGASGDLAITISRLTPAVLLESKASVLELFAPEQKPLHPALADMLPGVPGALKPLRWAAPGLDGAVVTGVLGTQDLPAMLYKSWQERVARAESLAPEQVSAPPLAQLAQGWLLLWYGAGSPFTVTKVPEALLPGPIYPNYPRIAPVQQADVPLLLVFEKAPKAIELKEEDDAARFLISYDGEAGKTAVLPLFGHNLRPAAETEKWLEGLPADVKARCDSWAIALAEFPVDVKESVAYDAAQDRVTITEKFEYVRVRPGGKKMAPLPAMLALAQSQGMALTLSAKPEDMKAPTQFGPTMLMPGDSFTWSLDGVGKAVHAQRKIGAPNPKAAELEKELVAEVDKLVEAGHLAPWICLTRRYGFVAFKDPSDLLYLLSEVLPALPPASQARLRAYMKAEYAAYPPLEVKEIKLDDGVRRENRKLPVKSGKYGSMGYKTDSSGSPTKLNEPHPAIYRALGLARYLKTVGEKPSAEAMEACTQAMVESLKHTDWATMAWFWGKYTRIQAYSFYGKTVKESQLASYLSTGFFADTMRQVHRDAAGLIGYLQLCRMAGKTPEPEAWGQLARLTALRFGLARYGRYLATSGIVALPEDAATLAHLARSGDFTKPENHVQQIVCINQHGPIAHASNSRESGAYQATTRRGAYGGLPCYEIAFIDMAPEFARLLGGLGFAEDAARFLTFFEKVQPTWFAAFTDCLHRSGSELAYMFPHDAHQLFMAHAWLAGTPPEKLERYIDQPWTPVGDLYYTHKLAETVKAYRGVKWE
jgi:hypothetical protein